MSRRRWALAATFLALGLLGSPLLGSRALGQQLGEGMSREGTVGPMSDEERRLFSGLICTCGCPRESLATCTCDIAAHRREVLREGLSKGTQPEVLKAEYVRTYGPEALALPPNAGAHRLVWLLPLGAVVLGGVLVGRWLRGRGRNAAAVEPSSEASPNASPPLTSKPDTYDERLEEELRQLEDER
jgi:cytochrome c-type biogenesis protein CcmH